MLRLYCPGPLRPGEMFSGIGALPEPATGSHVGNRGTPVAPCRLKAQRKRATRVGSPCSPDFPNIMSCLRSPITTHCKAAGNSLTAKGRAHTSRYKVLVKRMRPESLSNSLTHSLTHSLARACPSLSVSLRLGLGCSLRRGPGTGREVRKEKD